MIATYLPPPGTATVLVVGERNPYGINPRLALYHLPRLASGDRLRQIFGLSDLAYLRYLDRANLCAGRWSSPSAEAEAERLSSGPHAVCVLLGTKVREAFRGPPPFEVREVPRAGRPPLVLASLPHPSGLCRVWNDPENTRRARCLLRSVAPWVPWGSFDL